MRLIIAARDLDAWDLRMLRDIAVSLPRSGLTQKQKARYAHLFLDDGGDL